MHTLPYDIQRHVAEHLHPLTVARLAQACRGTHSAATDQLYLDLEIGSTKSLNALLETCAQAPALGHRIRSLRETRPCLTFDAPLGPSVKTLLTSALEAMPNLQSLELLMARDTIWENQMLSDAMARLPLRTLRLGVAPPEGSLEMPALSGLLPRLRRLRTLDLTATVTVLPAVGLMRSLPASLEHLTLRHFDPTRFWTLHDEVVHANVRTFALEECTPVDDMTELAVVFPAARTTETNPRKAGSTPDLKMMPQMVVDQLWTLAQDVDPAWATVLADGFFSF